MRIAKYLIAGLLIVSWPLSALAQVDSAPAAVSSENGASSPPGPGSLPGTDSSKKAGSVNAPGAADEPAADADPEGPEARSLRLTKEGLRLSKKGASAADKERALALLKEAVETGQKAQLAAETQGLLHHSYALVLTRCDKDTAALAELRLAARLVPGDREIRGDLASALLEAEEYDEAIKEAQAALALPATADERRELTATLNKARRERLKERLSVTAEVELGYDSNILQGTSLNGAEIQTIAGRSTGSSARTALSTRSGLRPRQIGAGSFGGGFASAISSEYATPVAAMSEAGVPLDVELSIDGRLAANKRVELWLGYDFSQLFQLLPEQDAYNFQSHEVKLRFEATPWERLTIAVSAAGFANFSGLESFSAFQGGISAKLKLTIRESPRWRTLVTYSHRYAASFATEDAALNADSDDLQLTQELRVKPVRIALSYTLHDVRSGVLVTETDYQVALPGTRTTQPTTLDLGQYQYMTPLGYLGNKVAATFQAKLPAALTLRANASYEYRLYDGLYSATFVPAVAQLQLPQGSVATMPVTLPAVQRADSVVALGVSLERELPHDFSLSLAYAFLDNLSNIANSLDNRSYVKHTVTLSAGYDF